MRVLHLSHDPLPDERIERSALAARKRGWEVYYAGGGVRGKLITEDTFKDIFPLPFSPRANLHLGTDWSKLKKRFRDVVSRTKPDIVHAHNIAGAKLASESELSFIYDDHEYWSKSSRLTDYRKFTKHITRLYASKIWSQWEKDIVARVPVLTVSETIAEEHRRIGKHVFVVPNMPTATEISDDPLIVPRSKTLSSAYIGNTSSPPHPVRDVSGLTELFSSNELGMLVVIGDENVVAAPPVYSTGVLEHKAMMNRLTSSHLGLIPWKSFWFHKYCNPNKAYEYVHAGLLVLATSDLTPVLATLGRYCIPIRNYEDLAATLSKFKDKIDELGSMRGAIVSFARNHCLWENYESRIFDAYSLA
jgi:hypothetical protein